MSYPKALDSDDPAEVVACVEAEYDCDVVQSKQRNSGLYLTIRSRKDNSMPGRLLRNLNNANYTAITMHDMPRDGEYRLEATFGPRHSRGEER
jgi:hypothetical protein